MTAVGSVPPVVDVELAGTRAPVQVTAEVVSLAPAGAYLDLAVRAPGVAEGCRPGQFVALAVGGPDSAMLLRRSFSVYRASPRDDLVQVVLAVHGRGTAALARLRPGDPVDVVGPLGRPFPLPRGPVAAVLVGGGYGSAPLFALAGELTARGCRVDMVLGAGSEDRLLGVEQAHQLASTTWVTTDDGSAGTGGRVSDVLPEVLARSGASLVYACGPMPMLAAVSELSRAGDAVAFTAVEEAMACGIGVCMTCVLPVVAEDGVTRMVRACVEGPVFRGERVRWSEVGTVPPGTYGAAR